MSGSGRLVGYLAALVCAGAGAYLLRYHGAAGAAVGTSWFEVIGHGMGAYFIGKGLYIARSTWLEAEQADRLRQLVELAALQRTTRNGDPDR